MNNHSAQPDIRSKLLALGPIHFLGIAGSGMAPLAAMASEYGAKISGSDLITPAWLDPKFFFKQGDASELNAIEAAGTLVVSSAIAPNNPALEFAKRARKPVIHRSDLLAIFSNSHRTFAVAGTHGKTTTSALIAHILTSNYQSPSWIIGASFADNRNSFCRGDSDFLVIEADESDGSFIKYHPFISVINNIEPDHMDFYGSEARLRGAFGQFMENTAPNGRIVYNADDSAVVPLVLKSGISHLGFGQGVGADVRLLHARSSGFSTSGEVAFSGQNIAFKLPLIGVHNAMNAVAALAACHAAGLDLLECSRTLAHFPGVSRRLQLYKTRSGAIVFDDYAHNPGKIKGCLTGLAASFPEKRILAVFQPHRFSRISSLYAQFVSSFRLSRLRAVVLPVYAAGEPTLEGFTPQKVADDISRESGIETFPVSSLKDAADLVKSLMDPNLDLLVTIGAGDVWRVAKDVSERF